MPTKIRVKPLHFAPNAYGYTASQSSSGPKKCLQFNLGATKVTSQHHVGIKLTFAAIEPRQDSNMMLLSPSCSIVSFTIKILRQSYNTKYLCRHINTRDSSIAQSVRHRSKAKCSSIIHAFSKTLSK